MTVQLNRRKLTIEDYHKMIDAGILTEEDKVELINPHPEEVFLVIAVADSSIEYDREVKLTYYAQAGIPEYWIVDLEERHIEAYRSPEKNYYKVREIASIDDSITFHAFELAFEVNTLLG